MRDQLLGLKIKERDWVVVGATPEQMLKLGFKQVGRNFPVFLHPETHEEYALARTERKTGKGYTEFVCFADSTVTLEDDLRRRDLTINAIAQTKDGKLIDPYGGLQDLKHKILKHVSPAFIEDPVRILRVARFAARFGDFTVHPDTIKFMHDMLYAGETDALVAERVWQELEKAIKESCPEKFFEVLQSCRALQKLFPEISSHLPQQLCMLKQAVNLTNDPIIRFAAFMSSLTVEEIKSFCKRYRAPKNYLELSLLTAKHAPTITKILSLSREEIVSLLENIDAFRRTKRFEQLLLACFAIISDSTVYNYDCANSSNNHQQNITQQWHTALSKTKSVEIVPLVQAGLKGENLKNKIHALRVEMLETFNRTAK